MFSNRGREWKVYCGRHALSQEPQIGKIECRPVFACAMNWGSQIQVQCPEHLLRPLLTMRRSSCVSKSLYRERSILTGGLSNSPTKWDSCHVVYPSQCLADACHNRNPNQYEFLGLKRHPVTPTQAILALIKQLFWIFVINCLHEVSFNQLS